MLQMPRGNLETVNPRPLVLTAVAAALQEQHFAAAWELATASRVDLNFLVSGAKFVRTDAGGSRHRRRLADPAQQPYTPASLLPWCSQPGGPHIQRGLFADHLTNITASVVMLHTKLQPHQPTKAFTILGATFCPQVFPVDVDFCQSGRAWLETGPAEGLCPTFSVNVRHRCDHWA